MLARGYSGYIGALAIAHGSRCGQVINVIGNFYLGNVYHDSSIVSYTKIILRLGRRGLAISHVIA